MTVVAHIRYVYACVSTFVPCVAAFCAAAVNPHPRLVPNDDPLPLRGQPHRRFVEGRLNF